MRKTDRYDLIAILGMLLSAVGLYMGMGAWGFAVLVGIMLILIGFVGAWRHT